MSTMGRLDEAVRLTGVSAYGARFTDLVVRYGEVVVLTGPNGSGKSTVSRVVVGELTAAGSVDVLGAAPVMADLKGRIGYLVKDLETMGSLTSRDVLDICAAVRGCTTAYAHLLADRIGLELDRPMAQLCRGQLRRLGIVQALMHEPELVVLDDPMTELDDEARRVLPVLLREAADRGAAVLVTALAESGAGLSADRIVPLRRDDDVDSRSNQAGAEQAEPGRGLEAARPRVVRGGELRDGGRPAAIERSWLRSRFGPAVRRGRAERLESVADPGDRPGRGHRTGPARRGAVVAVPDPAGHHQLPRLGSRAPAGRRPAGTSAGQARPG
ncbi:ATP-binding cassette domain-containing protein [Kribbella speibonae]|uniref:ATP-binding cassette domain-containing protein n=1 Tax=Kribbella speibonae TaxID=1572660 RepID=A0ABY2A8K1_9ACTN|nr:ATP-binding cassette domain-containing protein [Kribbella speibonae]TCC24792.1 ATP-binding cassette domain-containing protein [Kribbella speibonae]